MASFAQLVEWFANILLRDVKAEIKRNYIKVYGKEPIECSEGFLVRIRVGVTFGDVRPT